MTWLQTYTGRAIYPLSLKPEDINLVDIAHALSMQCRFSGHTTWHYSVAQHAVLVSKHVPCQFARWALLHDATEAYLVDLPRPVKHLMTEYVEAEANAEQVIANRFGLELPMPAEVKRADLEALATEYRDLMGKGDREWESIHGVTPWPERIERWTMDHAKATFLAVAKDLKIS
jgi:5'-deoxynucleotidase YfbR-like HD superfamily hydrolase